MCLNKITRRKGLKQSGVGYVVGAYCNKKEMRGCYHDTIYRLGRWYKAKKAMKIVIGRMAPIYDYEPGFHIFTNLNDAYVYAEVIRPVTIYTVKWDNPIVRGKTVLPWTTRRLSCIVARRRKITGVAE